MVSDAKFKQARPKTKPYKLTDRDGLSLLVKPNGSKLWRFRYKLDGRDKLLSLGKYPVVTLAAAREKVIAERRLIDKNLDPSKERKAAKLSTFKGLANEFFARGCPGGKGKPLDESTVNQLRTRCDKYLIPALGAKPVKKITREDVKTVLDSLVVDNKIETAYRVLALASRIFDIGHGLDLHPCYRLGKTLPARGTKHFAAITEPGEVGALLRAIDGYDGAPEVAYAVRIAPHVFLRSSELRFAKWSDVDFERKEWVIPAERMKMDREHILPLSKQVIALLQELKPITEGRDWLFPGIRSADRPISENTLNATLRRLGYTKEQHTTHGWRTTFSTNIKKQRKGDQRRFSLEASETQLAHLLKDATMAAYDDHDPYQFMPERRRIMQYWSDLLDRWRDDKKAVVRAIHG